MKSFCSFPLRRVLGILFALVSSTVLADPPSVPATAPASPSPDPRLSEVPFPAQNGWNGFLVLDNAPTGVWTVEAFDVFAQHGSPEIVGLDDLGRAQICVSYSGKWTPTTVISDGKWLGGLAHGDIDPCIAGAETYTGSRVISTRSWLIRILSSITASSR